MHSIRNKKNYAILIIQRNISQEVRKSARELYLGNQGLEPGVWHSDRTLA